MEFCAEFVLVLLLVFIIIMLCAYAVKQPEEKNKELLEQPNKHWVWARK
jgi:hypothetical protein